MPRPIDAKTNKSPTVSVIMPVYNAEKYLRTAIKSILNQTYKDFEFIIIDDGSTDKSAPIIHSYDDPRIIFRQQKNKGQTASLNEAIRMARGRYIARQDADDYSHRDRLKKQVEFLDQNNKVGLLGTNYRVVYENGDEWFTTNLFTNPADLKLAIVFSNQFGHGTVTIRKSVLAETGYYDESFKIAQDYDLWSRIARVSQIANLKDPLYDWLFHKGSLSTGNVAMTQEEVFRVRDREFDYFLKNKKRYNQLTFHPFSTRLGPRKYFEMKNGLQRNMSLLYSYKDLRHSGILSLILAIGYAPWRRITYHYLLTLLFKKKEISSLKYDSYIQ